MGVPKNFQKTVNLNKRVEALNDLTFYFFEYEVKLTTKIINEVYDNNKSFDDLEQFLGEIKFLGNKKALCKNRISALDSEQAVLKLKEWLNKAIESEIIESFIVKDVVEKTFAEELDDKNLTELLKIKGD